MFLFFVKVMIYFFSIYGILNFLNDCVSLKNCNINDENIKNVIFVKNSENTIEQYVRKNKLHNPIIIDLRSNDDTLKIMKKLEKHYSNMKILDINEGKEFLNEIINNF